MFDEENLQERYSCERGGGITLFEGFWSCDKCKFKKLDKIKHGDFPKF